MNRRDIAKLLNKLDELELFLNDKVASTKSGNPYHGEDGKFTTGPSGRGEVSEGNKNNKPTFSDDMKEFFDEMNSETGVAYGKEFNSVMKEFGNLGVDISKIKFETNASKLPKKMKEGLDGGTLGCVAAKKNLETVLYLNEEGQMNYGLGGDTKYREGKENKDQPFHTNDSPMGTIRHELGHIASYTLYMNSNRRKATKGDLKAGVVFMDINSRFKKIFGNNYSLDKLKLSQYGKTTHGEAVAEAFSNPNFSEDTRKIYDYYKKELAKKITKNEADSDEGWIVLCTGYKKG